LTNRDPQQTKPARSELERDWWKKEHLICLSSSDRTRDRAIDFDRTGQSFTGSTGQPESASA